VRILAVGLIFSILFASLPAKVWACGLNLCPMDHVSESQNDEKAMPCHQTNDEETQDTAKNSKGANEQDIKANQMACPCPDTYIDSTFIVESRKQFELDKLKLALTNNYDVAKNKQTSDPLFHYRPPPLRDSTRLQVILQVFII